jgi:hypothetical protein
MQLSITNVSEEPRPVGLRVLIDTYLGEGRGAHFGLADGRALETETALSQSEVGESLSYWVSSANPEEAEAEGVGLQYSVAGTGVTEASRVVFANWKRLTDSRYDFAVREGRRFSLLPYSINDSAVAVYYPEAELEPGETRNITSYLGNRDPQGYATGGRRSGLAGTLQSVSAAGASGTSRESLLEDVVATNEVLAEIDQLLSNPEDVTAEDIELITSILDQLEARKEDLAED